jgi:TnpA family transposase
MPRIRNWKHLTLYTPTAQCAVEDMQHIRELFSETIDWPLIKTHLPDMLRVALSISQGKVRSSTILRKLGTASRKNKLFVAFRELVHSHIHFVSCNFCHKLQARWLFWLSAGTEEIILTKH